MVIAMDSKDYILVAIARHKLLAGLALIFGSLIFWALSSLLPVFLTTTFLIGILLVTYALIKTFGLNIVSGLAIAIVVIFALISLYATHMFAIATTGSAMVTATENTFPAFLIILIGIALTIMYIYLQED